VALGYRHICYQGKWEIELGRRHDLNGLKRVCLLAAVRVFVPRGAAQLQQSSCRRFQRRRGASHALTAGDGASAGATGAPVPRSELACRSEEHSWTSGRGDGAVTVREGGTH
jgi:hypothetical protein